MKYIFFLTFFLLISCGTNSNTFMCGNRACVDKKEFNEYFAKNLTIEIKSQKNKKNKNIDLIKLNTDSSDFKKNDRKKLKKEEKIRVKIEQQELEAEKIRMLEEQKIRENEERKQLELAKIKKLKEKNIKNEISNKKELVNKIVKKPLATKKKTAVKSTNNTSINTVKSQNKKKSICDEIKDCDIDKIAELLEKKQKNKPFPNISSN
jgi:hypothetical protein